MTTTLHSLHALPPPNPAQAHVERTLSGLLTDLTYARLTRGRLENTLAEEAHYLRTTLVHFDKTLKASATRAGIAYRFLIAMADALPTHIKPKRYPRKQKAA